MATSKSTLATITLVDLERCYRIQTHLDRADDAVRALLGPRGIAVCELLRLAYQESIEIMRKGAVPALKRAEGGMYQDRQLPMEFWQRLMSLAPQGASPGEEPDEGGKENE